MIKGIISPTTGAFFNQNVHKFEDYYGPLADCGYQGNKNENFSNFLKPELEKYCKKYKCQSFGLKNEEENFEANEKEDIKIAI